jgi:hypothetical protein
VCIHEQRGRIDYLIVTGGNAHGTGRLALSKKFGINPGSIYYHSHHHISAEYRAAILAGPFRSEDDLRQLVAEEGVSVLQNFRALFNAHRGRWLVALEAGNDEMTIAHSKAMADMLWKIGKLTQEIAPPQTFVQNNVVQLFESPEYLTAITTLTAALRPFPDARQAVAAALRSLNGKSPPLIEDKLVHGDDVC